MSNVKEQFDKLITDFKELSAASRQALSREMTSIGDMMVSYIQTDKLSGQVLKTRSGQLRDSVFAKATESGGVVTLTVGTKRVPYAAPQEYGATIRIPEYSGKMMVFRAKSGDLVFTRHRRAYTVTLPERSFVRSAIRDKELEINERLESSVLRGLPQ